jgi:hypothetical protein
MTSSLEMSIPRARSENITACVLTIVVVFFSILAVYNLLCEQALISSGLWLAFVAFQVWSSSKTKGSFQKFAIECLGDFGGKQFVEITPPNGVPVKIRFGFHLLGYRFVLWTVTLNKVDCVEWSPGQATGMAGRDMKDWSVCMWFRHDDPTRRNEWSRKPDHDIYIIGPSVRKEETEAFGLSFVDFLRHAGVPLVRGKGDACFERVATAMG